MICGHVVHLIPTARLRDLCDVTEPHATLACDDLPRLGQPPLMKSSVKALASEAPSRSTPWRGKRSVCVGVTASIALTAPCRSAEQRPAGVRLGHKSYHVVEDVHEQRDRLVLDLTCRQMRDDAPRPVLTQKVLTTRRAQERKGEEPCVDVSNPHSQEVIRRDETRKVVVRQDAGTEVTTAPGHQDDTWLDQESREIRRSPF